MKFFINENYDHTRFEVHMKCRSFCPILPRWFYNKEEAKTLSKKLKRQNNMKKRQTKTMKLVKLKRSIMPPPTKVFEDKVKKSSKNYCRKSKSQ